MGPPNSKNCLPKLGVSAFSRERRWMVKAEDKDEARRILQEIDELSESAVLINNAIECLNKNGGRARLTVYTDGDSIVTELGIGAANIAMRGILINYNDLIAARKSNLETIIERAIVKLN